MIFRLFSKTPFNVYRTFFFASSLVFIAIGNVGCTSYSTNERLDFLEARMENLQAYDIRMGNLEERIDDIESDIGVIHSALPIRIIKGSSVVAESKKHTVVPVSRPASVSTPENISVQTLPVEQKSQPKETASISKEIDTIVDKLHTKQDASIAPMQMTSTPRVASRATSPQKIVKHATPKGEQARYATALKLYEQNKFNEAEKSFSAFLNDFPKSKLAPNAMYWFAECSYSKNDYATAVVNFKNVAAKYPKHDKAAAALYKLGLCYKKMNDIDNANFYWGILQSDFPMAEPTQLIGKQ